MVVLHKESDDPTVIDLSAHLTVADKIRRIWSVVQRMYFKRKFRPLNYFYVDRQKFFPVHRLLELLPFKPDIIIAHWISNFITALTLRDLNRMTGSPVLWYLIDMAPLTGGCHYAFDCNGYTRQCGYCPQLGLKKGKQDLSYRQWRKKRHYVREMDITAVAASTWLQKQLETCSVFRGKRRETILLGMDVETFRPIPRDKARKLLYLPADRKIIFFGAQRITEERKGIGYLVGALRLLHAMLGDNVDMRDRILVVTAGRSENAEQLDIMFDHRHIGFLNGDAMLAAAYQAADVFVNASIEDAGPMMVNESILCGTPVVSFDMGVAADLVHTAHTGYRARLRDKEDMAVGLRRILEMDDDVRYVMRENCRRLGLQLCHPSVQVRAFETLFAELDAGDLCRKGRVR